MTATVVTAVETELAELAAAVEKLQLRAYELERSNTELRWRLTEMGRCVETERLIVKSSRQHGPTVEVTPGNLHMEGNPGPGSTDSGGSCASLTVREEYATLSLSGGELGQIAEQRAHVLLFAVAEDVPLQAGLTVSLEGKDVFSCGGKGSDPIKGAA